jgi:lysozyme family protein
MNNINFDPIIDKIIAREGGYVDHTDDHGGPTKYGITIGTLRAYRHDPSVSALDVSRLTEDEAREIYFHSYCAPFSWVPSQSTVDLLVDGAVQHGVTGSIKILQRAIGTPDDGIVGIATQAKTLAAIANGDDLWRAVFGQRLKVYAGIIRHDASQRVFAAGWLNRLAGLCE